MSSLREEEMSILSEEESDSAPVVTSRRKWVVVAAVLAVGLVAFAGTLLGGSGSVTFNEHNGEDATMLFLKRKKKKTETPQVDEKDEIIADEEDEQKSESTDSSAAESTDDSDTSDDDDDDDDDSDTSDAKKKNKAQQTLNKLQKGAKKILDKAVGKKGKSSDAAADKASDAAEDKASEEAAEAELDLNIGSPQSAQDELEKLIKSAGDAGGANKARADFAFKGKPMAPKDTKAWLKAQEEQHKKVSASAQANAEQAAKDSLAETKAIAEANDKMVNEHSKCVDANTKCVMGCKADQSCLEKCTATQQKCADRAAGARNE